LPLSQGVRQSRPRLHMTVTLNFVSDIATPHVNQLLKAIAARPDVTLRLWYSANARPDLYGWKVDPTHQVVQAQVFGTQLPSVRLLAHALRHRDEPFLVCGWSNPTTRLLVPLLAATRAGFGFFTDEPNDAVTRGSVRRWGRARFLGLLRQRAVVFAVGKKAASYFVDKGFSPARVINLPLPVPVPAQIEALRARRPEFRAKLGAAAEDFLIVTGSRLVREKGFDLLLDALARFPVAERAKIRTLIVGSGSEEMNLKQQAEHLGLGDRVRFEPWMDFDDYCGYMSAADVVVHPARFDAYGGITLTAVALGVPVVGSRGAGAALDLIQHGGTGFLYDAEDVEGLVAHLRVLMERRDLLKAFAVQSQAVAATRTADNIASTLLDELRRIGSPHETTSTNHSAS
jgi:glycosyltransferase involved in cell wall biosynthesis